MTYWLSYGAGVNSTALLVLLVEGRLPQFDPFRVVFADTRDEKDETYAYIRGVVQPYLLKHGRELETVYPKEGVLERWERMGVTGSRILRTCTRYGKIEPLHAHIKANGGGEQLIGIDAGEPHRARPSMPTDPYQKHFPLVDLDIDRAGCVGIIQAAGLCVPPKSGCWHCPFMRRREVLALAREQPEKFARIEALEAVARERHRPGKDTPFDIAQWHGKPAPYWRARAADEGRQVPLFEREPELPCACYDGAEEAAHA